VKKRLFNPFAKTEKKSVSYTWELESWWSRIWSSSYKRTLARVIFRFYWPYHKLDVQDWCTQCNICYSRQGPQRHVKGLMKQFVVGAPLERVTQWRGAVLRSEHKQKPAGGRMEADLRPKNPSRNYKLSLY